MADTDQLDPEMLENLDFLLLYDVIEHEQDWEVIEKEEKPVEKNE